MELYLSKQYFFVQIVYYAGLMFWGVILTFIAAVSTLDNLAFILPFVNSLDPVLYAVIAGQLPVVVLMVFIMLIPTIMAAVAVYLERRKSSSAVQQEVFSW